MKDTKASIGDIQVPHVDPEIISRQISLTITID